MDFFELPQVDVLQPEFPPLETRLQDTRWPPRACAKAIAGIEVPEYLGAPVVQLCVIRGIRYHAGFCRGLRGLTPAFTRALNAQAIKHNMAGPEMAGPDEFPYCIWHPCVPSRQTCRDLLIRYPQMKYQVGRACAVAGYHDLYCELNLLPEVHIAEEARECGSLPIYNYIIQQPVKYAVFDDYLRVINIASPPIANLNGDTLIVAQLDSKQRFRRPVRRWEERWSIREDPGYEKLAMDITEDMRIYIFTSESRKTDQEIVVPLLYSPLPNNLPTVQKDLLILAAAYHGNIDRYARLRRSHKIPGERACLVRGIYQSPLFAKWCSLQPIERMRDWYNSILKAINARFIMSNDLSRLSNQTPENEIPYQIWYPQPAIAPIYEVLARRVPSMTLQAARACIVCDYQDSFIKINPPHDEALVAEARRSQNLFYLNDLLGKQRAGNSTGRYRYGDWKLLDVKKIAIGHSGDLLSHLEPEDVRIISGGVFDGVDADLRRIEISVCVAPDVKERGTNLYDIYGSESTNAVLGSV